MRLQPRALLGGGLGLAACALVACGGGSGLLSSDQASTLNAQLSQVVDAVGSGQCAAAGNAASGFRGGVNNLGGVNRALANELKRGADQLTQMAARDCRTRTTSTSTSTSTSSTPTDTTTSTSSSTPTDTTTTTNTPTDTGPATSPSPGGNSGSGSGNGGAGVGGEGHPGQGNSGGPGPPSGGAGTGNNGNGRGNRQ